jgi:hypothetical protein
MPLGIAIIASLLGGGLAGAFVSVLSNRIFHRRGLRTKFYPVLNNMYSAYVIRMQDPQRRYWTTVVGQVPAREDEEFVEHRSTFMSDLVQYNELKEARVLRKVMLDNSVKGDHTVGKILRTDLAPESAALNACLKTLHKKLKM